MHEPPPPVMCSWLLLAALHVVHAEPAGLNAIEHSVEHSAGAKAKRMAKGKRMAATQPLPLYAEQISPALLRFTNRDKLRGCTR